MTGARRWPKRPAEAGWAAAVIWLPVLFAITAGIGPSLSDDHLATALFVVPTAAFVTATLIGPRRPIPSSILWSTSWAGQRSTARLLVPAVPGLVAVAVTATGAYLGAGWSLLRPPEQGLARLLREDPPFLDWSFPAVAAAAAAAAGCLFVLVVVVPVGAALDARMTWRSDRREAQRLCAFVIGMLGLGLVIAAMVMVGPPRSELDDSPPPDRIQSMIESLHTVVGLLLGTSDARSSAAAGWITRVGIVCVAASLAIYWRSRPARTPTS